MDGRLTKVRAATVTGASHRARDEDGQDAVATATLADGRAVIAVADGAGSAPRAAEGSRHAVAAAIDAIGRGASIEEAFAAAARSLGDDAPAERATTLLVAVIGGDALAVGQVGDGHIIVRRLDGSYDVVGPVVEREYLNETSFLSSPNWRDSLFTASIDAADIDAIAVMTDGLQLVAVELATTTPHPGFFDPLFAWAASDDAADEELAAFLASPRLAERTDDDLTLALAVRATA